MSSFQLVLLTTWSLNRVTEETTQSNLAVNGTKACWVHTVIKLGWQQHTLPNVKPRGGSNTPCKVMIRVAAAHPANVMIRVAATHPVSTG